MKYGCPFGQTAKRERKIHYCAIRHISQVLLQLSHWKKFLDLFCENFHDRGKSSSIGIPSEKFTCAYFLMQDLVYPLLADQGTNSQIGLQAGQNSFRYLLVLGTIGWLVGFWK